MKYEIINLKDVKVIGIAREIDMDKGPQECPKFWQEYGEKYMNPISEGRMENAQQQAVLENHIGEFGICFCHKPDKFLYVIAGTYKGGQIPEGMHVYDLPDGKWVKFYFEGGMEAFQQQYAEVYQKWAPEHPELPLRMDVNMEWYEGMDIASPEYPCGVMVPVKLSRSALLAKNL